MVEQPDIVISSSQRWMSVGILLVLALIAGGMLFVQGQYDPGAWQEKATTAGTNAAATDRQKAVLKTAGDTDGAPGLTTLSPTENYDSGTLSDKIDGKADLYLSAGFKALACRRFALAGDKNRWMERYIYNMGDLRNAYAVFSAQRRRNAQPVDLTAHAYLAGNGLFFVHGPFYVEIVASEASPEMQKAMEALTLSFLASHQTADEDLKELRLLPGEHQIPGSLKLAASSAFGIEGMDGVFTAAYALDQAEALAFVSKRASSEDAEALAAKFHAFWLDFGGEQVAAPDDLPGAGIALILDNYEIALVQGPYLIGIHEATSLDFGVALVKQLQANISGGAQ